MKTTVIAFCLMMLMVFAELSGAEYNAQDCSTLQAQIQEQEDKIRKWEGLARNPQKIMVQFQCQPGEDIVACEARCFDRTKGDCFVVKGNEGIKIVWVILDAYQLEGHPRFDEFKANSQSRKDNVLGTAAGDTGLLPLWRQELKKMQDDYKENCSSGPKGPSLFDKTY